MSAVGIGVGLVGCSAGDDGSDGDSPADTSANGGESDESGGDPDAAVAAEWVRTGRANGLGRRHRRLRTRGGRTAQRHRIRVGDPRRRRVLGLR